jgi:hypothetical protein
MRKQIKNYKKYINVGTEKSCFFLRISKTLINVLKKNPLLHHAVEEGVIVAERYNYYAAGILVLSQLGNTLNIKNPKERNEVAHDFLEIIPKEESYNRIKIELKTELEKMADDELSRRVTEDKKEKYFPEIQRLWSSLYSQ